MKLVDTLLLRISARASVRVRVTTDLIQKEIDCVKSTVAIEPKMYMFFSFSHRDTTNNQVSLIFDIRSIDR